MFEPKQRFAREDGLSDESIDCICEASEAADIDMNHIDDAADISTDTGLEMAACMDEVFGEIFAEAFSDFGEQLEQGFTESFEGDLSFSEYVELGSLQGECEAGDNAACDDLWINSPVGSPEEAVAESCCGRSSEPRLESCEFWLG